MYCKKCGGKIESYASNCPFCGEPIANNNVQATYSGAAEGAPTSKGIGSWILTFIIMAISPINIIMLFVWAFGNKTKADPTFRSWARAQLIFVIIGVILSVLMVIFLMPVLMTMISELGGSLV